MRIADIDTPAVLIDLDRVEANLERAQAYADIRKLKLRPHVKTHKLPRLAKMQVALGAVGITCQKIGEAEAMAAGGLDDIFLPYNIIGTAKLDRLADLNTRVALSVTADSEYVIEGYAATFTSDAPLTVLVECDTGAGRCGVQSADAAIALARQITGAPGLRFGGLMTYPPRDAENAVAAWLADAARKLTDAGLPPPVVSSGGTPGLFRAEPDGVITEYRPGTYIYSDRMQVAFGHGTLENCALTVKATVVSAPTAGRVVLDAGSKALAADPVPPPFEGHGHILEFPESVIASLSEEHGVVDTRDCKVQPAIGQTVRVIPNHACVVTNLFDEVHLVRGDTVEEVARVTSRGALA